MIDAARLRLVDPSGLPDDALIIRSTDLSSFGDCRRVWHWSQQYDPRQASLALWTGEAAHYLLAEYYRQFRSFHRSEEAWHQWASEFRRARWKEFESDDIDRLVVDALETAKQLVQHYCQFDQDTPIYGAPVLVEERFYVPVFDRDGNEIPNTYFSGKFDLVLSGRSGTVIVDHKTLSEKTLNMSPASALDVDGQLTGYAYLWWRLTGEVPSNVIFNILIKKIPVPPEPLKRGGFSRSRSQPTTAYLYRQALRDAEVPESEYQDILTYLDTQGWNGYFRREIGHRNLHELQAFHQRLASVAEDLHRIRQDPDRYAYPAPSLYKCGWCKFLQACKSKDDGGNFQAILDAFPKTNLENTL